jgi:hypothetical protein
LFFNSSVKPTKSLFKANSLAFSKLICLPVNNSKDNSFSIDDSKSRMEPAMASTCFKLKPKALA